MGCNCGYSYCEVCSQHTAPDPSISKEIATLQRTQSKAKAKDILKTLENRIAKSDDGTAKITAAELKVLTDLYNLVANAKKELEKSESPFYEGMKNLNDAV